MTETETARKRAVARLDIVRMYMEREMDVAMFARLYNAGGISWQLLKKHGPVDAEDLDRWADICMDVGKEARDDS